MLIKTTDIFTPGYLLIRRYTDGRPSDLIVEVTSAISKASNFFNGRLLSVNTDAQGMDLFRVDLIASFYKVYVVTRNAKWELLATSCKGWCEDSSATTDLLC